MAFKKNYKKKTTKSKKKRAPKKMSPTFSTNHLSMVNLGQGFPKKVKAVHKFHEIFKLSSITGSVSTHYFSCNALWRPDITGATTHAPMYTDQLAALYDQYTVIGSKCTFKISNANSVNNMSVVYAFINDDLTLTPTTDAVAEQSGAKSIQIPSSFDGQKVMTLNWSSKKAFGKNVLSNPNFTALVNNRPNEQQYFMIYHYAPFSEDSDVVVTVDIEYIAIWTELRDIAGSAS